MHRDVSDQPPAGSPAEAVPRERTPERPTLAHVLPFLAWLFVAHMLGEPAGWKYAVRSAVCLGLFLYFRPWQWYAPLQWKHLPLAVAVGLGVFVVWIAGETQFVGQWPAVQAAYQKFCILPPWRLPEPPVDPHAYSPAVAGLAFTITRILGSALVIALIEEFFWRGFLYRWMLRANFLKLDLGTFDWKIFLFVALFFGLEHHRWLVGILAGLAYGWMLIRTRDIWAVAVAHAVTNLVLGLYVVWSGNYAFWS